MVRRGWDDNLLSSENGSDVLFVLIVLYELEKWLRRQVFETWALIGIFFLIFTFAVCYINLDFLLVSAFYRR